MAAKAADVDLGCQANAQPVAGTTLAIAFA
jgi:hypothetical protein